MCARKSVIASPRGAALTLAVLPQNKSQLRTPHESGAALADQRQLASPRRRPGRAGAGRGPARWRLSYSGRRTPRAPEHRPRAATRAKPLAGTPFEQLPAFKSALIAYRNCVALSGNGCGNSKTAAAIARVGFFAFFDRPKRLGALTPRRAGVFQRKAMTMSLVEEAMLRRNQLSWRVRRYAHDPRQRTLRRPRTTPLRNI